MTAAPRFRQLGTLRRRRRKWVLELRAEDGADASRRTLRIEVGPISVLRTKPAARAEADRQLVVHGLGERLRGRRILLGAYAHAYKAAHIAIKTPSSRAVFGSYLERHLLPTLGHLHLDEIDVGTAQRLVASLAAKELAPATVKAIVDLLRRILARARLEGYAANLIAPRILAMPKATKAETERRCLTSAECRAIIAAAPQPWRTLFAVLAHTGVRGGEALGLHWSDIDFTRHLIRIRQAANRGKLQALKSKNSRADIPMPAALEDLLQDFQASRRSDSDLLFPSPHGGPYWGSGVRRHHLAPILKALGIAHAGLHSFRHGAATRLFEAGASAPVVKAMLRHGNIQTTLRYTHVNPLDQRNASDAASALLVASSATFDCGAHIPAIAVNHGESATVRP